MILQVEDFQAGLIKIAGSLSDQSTTANLQTFITSNVENGYIREMLGYELGNEFIADLSGTPSVPADPKWTYIFNEFDFEHNSRPYTCNGIKSILTYLIYNDYVSQQNIQNYFGGNGSVRTEAATSEGITGKTTVIHNRAVEQIDRLQAYIKDNSDTYDNFKGILFQFQSGI